MKFQVKRVAGAQAEDAARLGLVKITASSAEHLFDLGIPFYIVGNNVNGFHFFGGWSLAMGIDPEQYLGEDWTFKRLVGNWSQYNENSETGKAAFFVKRKYVASPDDIAAEAKKRSHKSKTGAKGKRRKGNPSRATARARRIERAAARHGVKIKPKQARDVMYHPSVYREDPLAEREREYRTRRGSIASGSSFYGGPGSKYPSVFDPRSADDYGLRPTHEKFMGLPRPALPNPPRRSKKARRRSR
jgi:hypothetical protein